MGKYWNYLEMQLSQWLQWLSEWQVVHENAQKVIPQMIKVVL